MNRDLDVLSTHAEIIQQRSTGDRGSAGSERDRTPQRSSLATVLELALHRRPLAPKILHLLSIAVRTFGEVDAGTDEQRTADAGREPRGPVRRASVLVCHRAGRLVHIQHRARAALLGIRHRWSRVGGLWVAARLG